MKIKELIKQLQECDPEKEIEFSFCPIAKKETEDDSFDINCDIELMGVDTDPNLVLFQKEKTPGVTVTSLLDHTKSNLTLCFNSDCISIIKDGAVLKEVYKGSRGGFGYRESPLYIRTLLKNL